MKFIKSEGQHLPANLLEKAFLTYYPEKNFDLYCEPFFEKDKPHWAFDNFRCQGSVAQEVSHVFYTQPSWGLYFKSCFGVDRIKCVTYACDPEFHVPWEVDTEFDIGFIGKREDPTGQRQLYLDTVKEHFTCMIRDDVKVEDQGLEYSKCKVIFNPQRYEEINIRFFEALALGAQVVSYSPALCLFAVEGEHYLTFRSPSEAVEKIKWLLNHENERNEMKRKAREHVTKYHTYKHRAEEMLRLTGGL